MLGQLNQNQIEEVLHQQVMGRIGCHADDMTYIVPISYAYDGEYIYCHTHEGMKVKMMRSSPKVCFEVDTILNIGNWESVIAWGEFEELTEEPDRHDALKKLHGRTVPGISGTTIRLSAEWPFTPNDIDKIEGIVFRIRLTTKTGRCEHDIVHPFLAWG